MQYVTILGLSLFSQDAPAADLAAYAHAWWILQFVQQTLFGVVALASGRVKVHHLFSRLTSRTADSDAPAA
jgi:hypothetical protein